MTLTKKYRLVWNPETLKVIGFPMEEHIGSETIVGFGMMAFESDDINDILFILDSQQINNL